MAVDWSAPHMDFTIAAYLLSALALGLLIWSTLRISSKRQAELRRLEERLKDSKKGGK